MPLTALAALPDQLASGSTVFAVAPGPDGTTYVGGTFTQAGTDTGKGGMLDAATGLVNRDFPKIVGTGVFAMAPDGFGGWYIGGFFSQVGGKARNNLAHIDSSGAVTNWDPNANNTVYAMALSGSILYVGGSFSSVGGITRYSLAAIGTDGTLGAWNPGASGGSVRALAVDTGIVFIGGDFTTVCLDAASTCWNNTDVQVRNGLAAFGATDGTLQAWNPNANVGTNIRVYALAVSDNRVYIGGTFTSLGCSSGCSFPPSARRGLAAVGTDGSLMDWNPNVTGGTAAGVYTLDVSASTVYVGGNFSAIGCASGCSIIPSTSRTGAAAISTNAILQPWNPRVNNLVQSLVVTVKVPVSDYCYDIFCQCGRGRARVRR
jgi:hypothetical protein